MNPDISNKALQQIEALCEEGCTQVNQILKKAHNGESIKQLADFDKTEAKQIIHELGQIMSVYDETTGSDASKSNTSKIK